VEGEEVEGEEVEGEEILTTFIHVNFPSAIPTRAHLFC